ncbi:MAG TPA: amino acid permease [Acidimicrobiales bacterium]|jgi:urea carboxylase system permease|nr:amino acid permease [Acidimicrobiales bacterium]
MDLDDASTTTPPGHASSATTDSKDLETFGYKQELHRTLGLFSSFAAAFSYISPSTGIFTLFAFGLVTLGGVFIWSWPVVAIGQFIVALNFAEVSSHYPVAGSVFQWTKYLAGRPYAWFTGWIYIFAGILTVTAVVVTIPLTILPALDNMGWHVDAGALHDQIWVAAIVLVIITILNIFSVKLVAVINNTGVFFEIIGMVVFAIVMLIVHHHQSISIVTNSGGIHVTLPAFFAAMFMSLFVIYGFDTASTLAEETHDPRRRAPQAVLMSVSGAFVIGGIFLVALLMAIPNLSTAIKDGWGPAQIIDANFDKFWATVYLLVVTAAIFVCCMAIMAATVRLCFGMARDNRLPASRYLAKVHPTLRTPIWSCIAIAVIAAIPMLKYAGAGIVAIAATAMIYLSYFLGNAAVMYARSNGWPKVASPFKLGRWGVIVNVLALAYGGAMLINFAWPRAASNPEPNQTAGALSLGVDWLNKIPILYTVFLFVVIIGIIYYYASARRHPMAVVVPPDTGPVVIPPESLAPEETV